MRDNLEIRDMRDGGWLWIDKAALEVVSEKYAARGVAVYAWLCNYANSKEQGCFPSISRLAAKCKLNRHTVIDILRGFEADGVVMVSKSPGRPSRYTLLDVGQTSASRGTGASGGTGVVPGEAPPPVPGEALEQELINNNKLIRGAGEVFSAYAEKIKKSPKSKALKVIKALLKADKTKDDLLARIEAYARVCRKDDIPDKFRIQAHNFFGEDARYLDYEPVKPVEYGPADPDCSECCGTGEILAPGSGKMFPCRCRKKQAVSYG